MVRRTASPLLWHRLANNIRLMSSWQSLHPPREQRTAPGYRTGCNAHPSPRTHRSSRKGEQHTHVCRVLSPTPPPPHTRSLAPSPPRAHWAVCIHFFLPPLLRVPARTPAGPPPLSAADAGLLRAPCRVWARMEQSCSQQGSQDYSAGFLLLAMGSHSRGSPLSPHCASRGSAQDVGRGRQPGTAPCSELHHLNSALPAFLPPQVLS